MTASHNNIEAAVFDDDNPVQKSMMTFMVLGGLVAYLFLDKSPLTLDPDLNRDLFLGGMGVAILTSLGVGVSDYMNRKKIYDSQTRKIEKETKEEKVSTELPQKFDARKENLIIDLKKFYSNSGFFACFRHKLSSKLASLCDDANSNADLDLYLTNEITSVQDDPKQNAYAHFLRQHMRK